MKKTAALITSLFLLANLSVALAGGHKSRAARDGGTVSADTGNKSGAKERNKERNHEKNRGSGDSDSRDNDDDSGKNKNKSKQDKANKGNEQSQEMRDRRDERKEIQEEYRGTREPGQEGGKKANSESGKKPWYKFWE
jgi:hypothetical protein